MKRTLALLSSFVLAWVLCSSPAMASGQETQALSAPDEQPAKLHDEAAMDMMQGLAQNSMESCDSGESVNNPSTERMATGAETVESSAESVGVDAEPSDTLGAQPQETADINVRYCAHVQQDGWQDWASNGEIIGTVGRSLRMEAFKIELRDANDALVQGLSYQMHVQGIGWQDWAQDGALGGTEGQSRRVEAIRIRLSDELLESYDIWYSTHIQTYGWLGWAKNGEAAGSSGKSRRLEAVRICVTRKGELPSDYNESNRFVDGVRVAFDGHIQHIGWESGDQSIGTTGQSLRIEALRARLVGGEYEGDISYSAHVQRQGWQDTVSNGELCGTTGQSLRIEALTMSLGGNAEEHYDVWYRLHVQKYGWLGWACNGEKAGTAGLSLRVESIQALVLPKGSPAPQSEDSSFENPFIQSMDVSVAVSVQEEGWQAPRTSGQTAGTIGQSKGVERLQAALVNEADNTSGGIAYRVRPVGGEWSDTFHDGEEAGVDGQPIDGVCVALTGDAARAFDVWYRAYISNYGWLSWIANDERAGTEGLGQRIEALEVMVLRKDTQPSGEGSEQPVGYFTSSDLLRNGQPLSQANEAQRRIVAAAYSTPSAPAGYCAMWVENVYANAGFGSFNGDACDLYDRYCHWTELSDLKAGMIVAVSTHPHSSAGSIWGHVGVFIGDGKVKDSVYGYVRTSELQDWIDYYGASVPVKWGWLGNVQVV